MVRSDRLARAMNNELITAINRSCLNLNAVLNLPHMVPSLQFICGLGPRKAKALLVSLQNQGAINREEVRGK